MAMNYKGTGWVNGECPGCEEMACNCCDSKIYECVKCKRSWVMHSWCMEKLGWTKKRDEYESRKFIYTCKKCNANKPLKDGM